MDPRGKAQLLLQAQELEVAALLRRTWVPRLSRAADLLNRQRSGLQTPFLLSICSRLRDALTAPLTRLSETGRPGTTPGTAVDHAPWPARDEGTSEIRETGVVVLITQRRPGLLFSSPDKIAVPVSVGGSSQSDGGGVGRAWPTHYGRTSDMSPRCPRTAVNSQRSPPPATREPEAGAGFEPVSNAREHARNA